MISKISFFIKFILSFILFVSKIFISLSLESISLIKSTVSSESSIIKSFIIEYHLFSLSTNFSKQLNRTESFIGFVI